MKDTTQKMNQQITITATNKKTSDEYTFSSKNNGEFILALEEGEYTISVDIDGFLPFKKDLKVSDIGTISEEELTIVLQPK